MRLPRHWRGADPNSLAGNRWERCDNLTIIRTWNDVGYAVYSGFGGHLRTFQRPLEEVIQWVDHEFPIKNYSTPRPFRTPQCCNCTQNQLFLADINQALNEEEEKNGS